MFEPVYEMTPDAIIKVVGVGGGGGNALNHMVRSCQEDDIGSVEFFSVNTDAQVLRSSSVRNTVQIGASITHGLGAGADPNIGYQSAEEDREALGNMINGADMVFIAAGMGGGTGTGAAPVIAEIAKSQEALTVAIVTKPFNFEGKKRAHFAEQGIKELSKNVDSLIIIQNEKLLKDIEEEIGKLIDEIHDAGTPDEKIAEKVFAEAHTEESEQYISIRTESFQMGYAGNRRIPLAHQLLCLFGYFRSSHVAGQCGHVQMDHRCGYRSTEREYLPGSHNSSLILPVRYGDKTCISLDFWQN